MNDDRPMKYERTLEHAQRILLSIASTCALLAAAALGQEGVTGASRPGVQAYARALGDDAHHYRRISALGNGRHMLEYNLYTKIPFSREALEPKLGELEFTWKQPAAGEDALGLGRIGFSERWLLAYLNREEPRLDDLQIVDVATGRSHGGAPTTSLTRSVVLTGPESAVEGAVRLLDAYAQRLDLPVEFDCRLIAREVENVYKAVEVAVLDERGMRECLQAAARDGEGVQLLGQQIITATTKRPAHFSLLNQLAYVQDFKLETVPGPQGPVRIADPIIGLLTEGFALNLTPLIDPGGETLHLSASVEVAKLKRPLAELEVDIGAGDPVTFQLPEMSKTRWASEELSLGSADVGFQVRNLRYVDWDEQGEARTRALEVLIQVRVVEPVERGAARLGEVLGYDAATQLAFVRLDRAPAESRTRFSLEREGELIAEGVLVELQPALMILRLESGEVRAGDSVR